MNPINTGLLELVVWQPPVVNIQNIIKKSNQDRIKHLWNERFPEAHVFLQPDKIKLEKHDFVKIKKSGPVFIDIAKGRFDLKSSEALYEQFESMRKVKKEGEVVVATFTPRGRVKIQKVSLSDVDADLFVALKFTQKMMNQLSTKADSFMNAVEKEIDLLFMNKDLNPLATIIDSLVLQKNALSKIDTDALELLARSKNKTRALFRTFQWIFEYLNVKSAGSEVRGKLRENLKQAQDLRNTINKQFPDWKIPEIGFIEPLEEWNPMPSEYLNVSIRDKFISLLSDFKYVLEQLKKYESISEISRFDKQLLQQCSHLYIDELVSLPLIKNLDDRAKLIKLFENVVTIEAGRSSIDADFENCSSKKVKKVEIRNSDTDGEILQLSLFQNVEELRISCCFQLTYENFSKCSSRALKTIALENAPGNWLKADVLKSVQELDLRENFKITDEDIEKSTIKNVKKLNISMSGIDGSCLLKASCLQQVEEIVLAEKQVSTEIVTKFSKLKPNVKISLYKPPVNSNDDKLSMTTKDPLRAEGFYVDTNSGRVFIFALNFRDKEEFIKNQPDIGNPDDQLTTPLRELILKDIGPQIAFSEKPLTDAERKANLLASSLDDVD